MNYESWNLEADRLKKCVDYTKSDEQISYQFFTQLVKHLQTKPDAEPTTPLPEINEPSTVEKFGDGWIEWQYGSSVIPPYGCKVEVRTRGGSTIEGISGKFGWKPMGEMSDIIAYRVVKD